MSQPAARPLVVVTFANRVVAFDAHNGQRAWEAATKDPHGYGMLVVEQEHVVHVFHGTATCLRYADGFLLWKTDLPRAFMSAPNLMVFAGCVMIANIGEVAALHLHTGQLLWHDTMKGYSVHGGGMAAPGVFARLDRRT